jgi:ATP-dependent exoDNAse (exonuclease V) beta subunit
LYEIVETLVRIFRLNTGSDIYLLRFLDVIKEYISKNNSDITAFIDWWEENRQKYSILVPESEDAIRVMTIHKAKGLESPIVILPYCSWEMDISGARDKIWATANVSPFNASSSFLVKAVSKLKESYFEKDYYEEAIMTNLDNLNLLYVAFTRAIDRLYINIPAKRIKIYDTGKLVWDTIESSGGLKDMLEGMKNKEFKKPDRNPIGGKKTNGAYKMNGIVSTGFKEKIVIKPLWKDVKLEKAVTFSEMKNRGIILHKALAGIKLPGDLDTAVLNLITEGLITKESSPDLRNELEAILNNGESGNWFKTDYEIKTEAELLLPGGETFRPDRVMIKNNEAIIIDYKTGSEKAEHKLQLNKYADILKEMGYKKIEKYLFYIMLKKTVRVQ